MEPSGEVVRAGQAEGVSPEKPCGNPFPSLPARGFPFPFPETLMQLVPGGVYEVAMPLPGVEYGTEFDYATIEWVSSSVAQTSSALLVWEE